MKRYPFLAFIFVLVTIFFLFLGNLIVVNGEDAAEPDPTEPSGLSKMVLDAINNGE